MAAPQRPRRQTGWNTYYPWLLALSATLCLLALTLIVISWIPFEPLPGVPPSTLDGPYIPGGLTILMGIVAGRQLYLRKQRGNATRVAEPRDAGSEARGVSDPAAVPLAGESASDIEQHQPTTTRWRAAALTGYGVLALVAALVVVGFGNGYSHRVVDQESRPGATYSDFTGSYSVVDSGNALCVSGDDYYTCVEMHRTMYNSVCTGQPLSGVGRYTCESLSDFVTDAQERYAGCGFGCRTAGEGKWGWSFLHLEADYVTVTVPALPEVSHEERCDFDLGILAFGQCPGRTD